MACEVRPAPAWQSRHSICSLRRERRLRGGSRRKAFVLGSSAVAFMRRIACPRPARRRPWNDIWMNAEMNAFDQTRYPILGALACLVSLTVSPAGSAREQAAVQASRSAGIPFAQRETRRGRQIAFPGKALGESRSPAAGETLNLARSQFLGGDFDQAIVSYSNAIQQDSQNSLAWFGRAMTRFKRDAAAIRTCTGDACKRLKRPIEDDYLTARRLDPNVLDAYRRWVGPRAVPVKGDRSTSSCTSRRPATRRP